MKEEIAELKSLASLLSIQNSLTSNTAYALVSIQNYAWEVREFGGRARTYYAIATLNGEPVPVELCALIQADSAQAASAWSNLQKAALITKADGALMEEIETAGTTYFGGYLELIASLDAAMEGQSGSEKVTYPIAFEPFFERSSVALDRFSALSQVAGEEVRQYRLERKPEKLQGLVVDASAVTFVVVLLILSMLFVSKRKTSRIDYATKVITQVADGDASHELDERASDMFEFKDLTSSLEKLIERTRKTQELMATFDDVEVREKERAEAK